MADEHAHYAFYVCIALLLLLSTLRRRLSVERVSLDTMRDATESGLTQPPSLHPVVDPTRCIGCESCVNICPEFPKHQVLGIVRNKAELVSPTDCIGHGACEVVCPTGAIRLVFGTAERGVELPRLAEDFSTNVPGVFIAGELGGMGLIRNAIEQGRQAMATITERARQFGRQRGVLDVLIVGAGPAGLSASLAAIEAGLCYRTIDQADVGGTVAQYPRGKLVMTQPAELPIVGSFQYTETSKEELISFWRDVHDTHELKVQTPEQLERVDATEDELGRVLHVTTTCGEYRARNLLLAIGRRGTPRKLGVPGEDQAKVVYSLSDPDQYVGQRVLVVGGGDSALEAACSIAEAGARAVTLSYRSKAFTRARKANRARLERHADAGTVSLILNSQVSAIERERVSIATPDEQHTLDNDAVVICAGGELPTPLLRNIGIELETKYGTR